jgi:hypothetical protein
MKLYEWQMIALMCAGIALFAAGLAWVHPGLFVAAVGVGLFILSMEADEIDGPKK